MKETGTSTLRYRFPGGGSVVTAQLAIPELLPLLERFYHDYQIQTPHAEGAEAVEIRLELTNEGYKLVGPSGDWYADRAGEAVALYEAELTDALLAGVSDFIHLHGAGVHGQGSCVVMVGPSSTGKSTLSFGLQLLGLSALSDDVVLIDPRTGAIHPFPRSIRVHTKALFRLGLGDAVPSGYPRCEPYLWAHPSPPAEGEPASYAPTALIYLERGRRTRLERTSASASLERLMVGRFGPGQPARDFDSLRRLATRTPSYRLCIRRFPEALTELRRTFFPDVQPATTEPVEVGA